MSDRQASAPPGYQLLPEGMGFTDVLRPVFRREQGDKIWLGMFVQLSHCNMIGICHGGALMTLADICAAQSIKLARGKLAATPTLSLSFDFINPAREGDWIEAHSDCISLKKRFGFASGLIRCEGQVICRYNGTFYYPDHAGFKRKTVSVAALDGQGQGNITGREY